MGARRDDMTSQQRMQLALQVLSPQRPHGLVAQLARSHNLARQTLYRLAASAKELLVAGLTPQRYGPQPHTQTIRVDRDRLQRSALLLSSAGLSQRDLAASISDLFDCRVSPSWVQTTLTELERAAATVNATWQPSCGETLAGDELFSNGAPNLLIVGNDSLYIYALTRQPARDGETWGLVLLDSPECPQFSSDGGSGLAYGVQAAELAVHQADWDHLLRPCWGQVARLEAQAYAALEAVEQRAAQFERAQTEGRLALHLAAWERLNADAERKVTRYDAFFSIVKQVDDHFGLIDLASGHVRDGSAGAVALRALGIQLQSWSGRIYGQISSALRHQAEALFRYQGVLIGALEPLIAHWGEGVIAALSRIWQLDADARRHPIAVAELPERQRMWMASLEAAVALCGETAVWMAWEAVSSVLGRSWRGSMLAECVNSLLRPRLAGRKQSDQGYLELFRFLHNVHQFRRGKRAGQSPAQLVGITLPSDPLTLLGLAPKVSL
jgi:hypothetical protein